MQSPFSSYILKHLLFLHSIPDIAFKITRKSLWKFTYISCHGILIKKKGSTMTCWEDIPEQQSYTAWYPGAQPKGIIPYWWPTVNCWAGCWYHSSPEVFRLWVHAVGLRAGSVSSPECCTPLVFQYAMMRTPARAWAATPPSRTLGWPSSHFSRCPRVTTGMGSWR